MKMKTYKKRYEPPKSDTDLGYADLQKKYDHICYCLTRDQNFEALIFFRMGVELQARSKTLMAITYKQIDLENLQVYDLIDFKRNLHIPCAAISAELAELIRNHMQGEAEEKLFKRRIEIYCRIIAHSTGQSFSPPLMRHMGKMLQEYL